MIRPTWSGSARATEFEQLLLAQGAE